MWDFCYHGKQLWINDCRGIQLLNLFLHSPHYDFHVLDLMKLVKHGKAVGDLALHSNLPEQHLAQEGLTITYDSVAIAGLDARARTEYRDRLCDLEAAITEAEAHHDLGRLERLQIEKQALLQELMSNSYRGHRRQESPIVRNARTNIRKHLRKVREKIRREAPDLGEHLEEYLSTGTYCSYRPPLDIPPWE